MMVAFDEIAIGVSDFLEHPDQYNPDTLPLETSRITGRGDGDPAEQRANIPETIRTNEACRTAAAARNLEPARPLHKKSASV